MRHRKEGGVSLRASINGRTGISGSDGFLSSRGAIHFHPQPSLFLRAAMARPWMPNIHIKQVTHAQKKKKNPAQKKKALMALSQIYLRQEPTAATGMQEIALLCVRAYCGCPKTRRALEINLILVCYLSNNRLIET